MAPAIGLVGEGKESAESRVLFGGWLWRILSSLLLATVGNVD